MSSLIIIFARVADVISPYQTYTSVWHKATSSCTAVRELYNHYLVWTSALPLQLCCHRYTV